MFLSTHHVLFDVNEKFQIMEFSLMTLQVIFHKRNITLNHIYNLRCLINEFLKFNNTKKKKKKLYRPMYGLKISLSTNFPKWSIRKSTKKLIEIKIYLKVYILEKYHENRFSFNLLSLLCNLMLLT